MGKIGVIGLGIIGGSIVKAIQKYGLSECVAAYDTDTEAVKMALRENTVQIAAGDIDDSFRECDIIFICVPVDAIPQVIHKLSRIAGRSCILTDAGSTKSGIMSEVRRMSLRCPFIGGHPMAGSEASGYVSSRAGLFENAYYILTPMDGTDKACIERLAGFVRAFGGLPVVMEPSVHDYVTAAVSHVPHVLASALVNTIRQLDGEDKLMHTLAAGGFKDITRIASSSPAIWKSICKANRVNIIDLLLKVEEELSAFRECLAEGKEHELDRFFASAKEYRDSFSEKRLGAIYKTYDITLDVEDKPGVIAAIAVELGGRQINIKNIGISNSREMEGGAMEICFYDRESQVKSYNILKAAGYSVSYR